MFGIGFKSPYNWLFQCKFGLVPIWIVAMKSFISFPDLIKKFEIDWNRSKRDEKWFNLIEKIREVDTFCLFKYILTFLKSFNRLFQTFYQLFRSLNRHWSHLLIKNGLVLLKRNRKSIEFMTRRYNFDGGIRIFALLPSEFEWLGIQIVNYLIPDP